MSIADIAAQAVATGVAYLIGRRNEHKDSENDSARLDWYEANHAHIVPIVDVWYSRKGYGQKHQRHASLREAIDYARSGNG